MELCFDKVTIKRATGNQDVTPEAYMAMPIHERVELTGNGNVQFSKNGAPVPATEAVKSMHAAKKAAA